MLSVASCGGGVDGADAPQSSAPNASPGNRPIGTPRALVHGGKRLVQLAASGLAARLQLHGWADNWAEARYKALFSSMDLTRDFYFSYTYDLTNTLQANVAAGGDGGRDEPGGVGSTEDGSASAAVAGASAGSAAGATSASPGGFASRPCRPTLPRDKFIWNHHLASGLFRCVRTPRWCPPIVHGFFLQLSASTSPLIFFQLSLYLASL